MAINIMNKSSDGRRAKNRNKSIEQIPLIESLKIQISQRPHPKFREGNIVRTPIGYRRVDMQYYSSISGWRYQVLLKIEKLDRPRPYYRTYEEHELKPIAFSHGDLLNLPSQLQKPIDAIGLSPSFTLLLGFEIRPQYWSWYTEDQIYRYNIELVTAEYALSQLYKAYVKETIDKEQVIKYSFQVLPELAI